MRVALLSTPHHPTPPHGQGGSEQVAALLAAGLARRGHEVVLAGHPDSHPGVPLLCAPGAQTLERFEWRELAHVARCLPALAGADVIHNHCLVAGPALAPLAHAPMVTTLHYLHPLAPHFPAHPYVAISETMRVQGRSAGLRIVATVPHGIDPEPFRIRRRKEDYLLFLGRMNPIKGPDLAIEVARRCGARLVLAGPHGAFHGTEEFFATRIRPHLDGRITYVGEVAGQEKVELLARARCLLLPLRWDEPFGLVMVEAMAAGTPVVAMRRGAAPEVVEDGETGFLVDSLEEMVAAVARVETLDPDAGRRLVARRFTVERMVEGYEAVYRRLIDPRPHTR